MSKHLTINPNNPSPTMQPYLVLHFQGDNCAKEWFIDVEGKIDLYLKNYTSIMSTKRQLPLAAKRHLPGVFNWMTQATPLLQEMMRELASMNRVVNRVSAYEGSCGTNYVLRNGQFFKWFDPRLDILPKDVRITEWPDIAKYIPTILGNSGA